MSGKETIINRGPLQTQVVKSPYDARDYQIVAEKDFPETFELMRGELLK